MREDKLTYKDFIGSVHFSASDMCFYGVLEGVPDLVTYEANTVKKLQKAFKDAVDDYILLCDTAGRSPHKSFKGSFNIRVGPELHALIFKKATLAGKTLNQYVSDALKSAVKEG